MRIRSRAASAGTVILLAASLSACNQIANLKAKKALKDANSSYQSANYREAVTRYEEVINNDPSQVVVYFYLGNSYDNLFKPGKDGAPPDPELLKKAIQNYKLAVERSSDPAMKKLAPSWSLLVG